jgi:hypothetical protein
VRLHLLMDLPVYGPLKCFQSDRPVVDLSHHVQKEWNRVFNPEIEGSKKLVMRWS